MQVDNRDEKGGTEVRHTKPALTMRGLQTKILQI